MVVGFFFFFFLICYVMLNGRLGKNLEIGIELMALVL